MVSKAEAVECRFLGGGTQVKKFEAEDFRLVVPTFSWLYASAEMWPSGRRRSPAKGVGPEGSRGFESHRLRHLTFHTDLFRSPWAAFSL